MLLGIEFIRTYLTHAKFSISDQRIQIANVSLRSCGGLLSGEE